MRLGVAATGLALVVAIPRGLAANASATENFPVQPELTVSGIPASVTYDRHGEPVPPGGWSDRNVFTVTIDSTTPIRVDFSGSEFVGPGNLSADTRFVSLGRGLGGLTRSDEASSRPAPSTEVVSWNPIYISVAPVASASFRMTLRAHPPTDAPAGQYSASTELVFTTGTSAAGCVEPTDQGGLDDAIKRAPSSPAVLLDGSTKDYDGADMSCPQRANEPQSDADPTDQRGGAADNPAKGKDISRG